MIPTLVPELVDGQYLISQNGPHISPNCPLCSSADEKPLELNHFDCGHQCNLQKRDSKWANGGFQPIK